MITSYKPASTSGGYPNLASDSADFICTNCTVMKGQKGKRKSLDSQTHHTRTITDYESGEIICSTCGMVISDKIQSSGSEWRNSEQVIGSSTGRNAPRRHSGSTFSLARHDKGLYTVIGEKDRDAYGRQLDPLVRHSMNKIRMYDMRTRSDFRDRNFRKAFTELYGLKEKISFSDAIAEKAAYIYRKAEKRGIIRGRTISSILAACLYIACREMSAAKTLKEIAKASDIRLKTLSKDYRLLLRELDLKVPDNDLVYCVSKIGNAIPTSEKTKRRAIELVYIINKKDRNTYTSGKDPMGLAATALFVASTDNGEGITQKEVASAAGLTPVTIRCRLKEIGKYLDCINNQE